jgi:hypothetical protein
MGSSVAIVGIGICLPKFKQLHRFENLDNRKPEFEFSFGSWRRYVEAQTLVLKMTQQQQLVFVFAIGQMVSACQRNYPHRSAQIDFLDLFVR